MVMMLGLVKIESFLWENKRVKVGNEKDGKKNTSNSRTCLMGKLACVSCCSASLLSFRFHFLRLLHYSTFNPIPSSSSSSFFLLSSLLFSSNPARYNYVSYGEPFFLHIPRFPSPGFMTFYLYYKFVNNKL